jgi:hypothetical protein
MLFKNNASVAAIHWALRLTVTALLVVGFAEPAAAQSYEPARPASATAVAISSPYAWLYNFHSGKCLTVPGAAHAHGVQVRQFSCLNRNNLGWQPVTGFSGSQYFIRSENQRKPNEQCLTVNRRASGAAVVQEPCGKNPANPPVSQRWQFIRASDRHNYGWDLIQSVWSGFCVSITNSSKSNNAEVRQSTCYRTKGTLHTNGWFIFVAPGTKLPCPCAGPRGPQTFGTGIRMKR